MRELATHSIPAIPPLAYLATVSADKVSVYHGARVHMGDGFITDGTWSGPITRAPQSTEFLAGTCVQVRATDVKVSAGNNPTDRVYAMRDGTTWLISNSMAFLCAYVDTSLDPSHVHYRSFFASKSFGLRVGPREIPLAGSHRVRVLMDEELILDDGGSATFRSRPTAPRFRSFEAYEEFVRDTVDAIIANAGAAERECAYPPIVALSTGYDSVATAALVSAAGVTDAITMRRYAEPGDPASGAVDHPAEVASSLNLTLIEVERGTWADRQDLPDAAIGAAMGNFIDIAFLAMEPHITGRTLFVGYSGDEVWTRRNFRAYRDVVRGDTTGQGLGEWRLRTNTMLVPVPYIGHTSQPDLFRLANSPALSPWSVGGAYDRPVARRIAETAGVRRGAFGTKKYGGSALVGSNLIRPSMTDVRDQRSELGTFLTRKGLDSYLSFYEQMPRLAPARVRMQIAGSWAFHKLDALNYRVGERLHDRGMRGIVPRAVMAQLGSRLQVPLDAGCFLPHWGVATCKAHYPSREVLQAAT